MIPWKMINLFQDVVTNFSPKNVRCGYKYPHTYLPTYIHTYIHTYIQTDRQTEIKLS